MTLKRTLTKKKGQWRKPGCCTWRAPSPRTNLGKCANSRAPALDILHGLTHAAGEAAVTCQPFALVGKSVRTSGMRGRALALCRGLNPRSTAEVFDLPKIIVWVWLVRDKAHTRLDLAGCAAVVVWRRLSRGAGVEILLAAAPKAGQHKKKSLASSLVQHLLRVEQGPFFLHAAAGALRYWKDTMKFTPEGGARRDQAKGRGMYDPQYEGTTFMSRYASD